MENVKEENGTVHKVLTIVGTVMCVILVPILIFNLTLIVKSLVKPEEVPDAAGFMPLIVLTDSMYPDIKSGDLIICKTIDAEEVRTGDVISFFDPAGSGTSIVTHRVVEVKNDGGLSFTTKGDANNVADEMPVPAEKLVGVYKTRIPGAGNIAMFMQTTPGLLVCVLLPLVLLVGYDTLRRRRFNKKQDEDTAALRAELEALRAEKAHSDQ